LAPVIAPAVIAVIGGGASGTLVATHLARAAAAAGRPVDILVIEPGDIGRGVAYGTRDERHRLNVVASALSVRPEQPDHFVTWLHETADSAFAADDFAARRDYGRYLADALADAAAGAPTVRLERLATRATDLRQHGHRWRVSLADGTSRPADAVVLALGWQAPAIDWAPMELRRSPRFIANPWAATTAEPARSATGDVVLVGAGLTMADLALCHGDAATLHAVSRHGLMPLAHTDQPADGAPAPDPPSQPSSLARLRRLVFAHIRATVAGGGDWRAAIDSLRPNTAAMWQSLPAPQRELFRVAAARRWDRVRHRVAPTVGQWLDQRHAAGQLQVHRAVVTAVIDAPDAVHVHLSNGQTIAADTVVNCTGPSNDLRRSVDPLVVNLLSSGVIRPGPHGLGIDTDGSGRVLSRDDAPPTVWTIGPPRQGQLWETVAIPEIRAQAVALAADLLGAVEGPDVDARRSPPRRVTRSGAADQQPAKGSQPSRGGSAGGHPRVQRAAGLR
jgi:uncharacterized NAD(P)/FAD-binding protein YdhS